MDDDPNWRGLLSLAADLAFETDAVGRFVLLLPDDVLGRPARTLIGEPAEQLLAVPIAIAAFNPFRAAVPVRGRRAWLNRVGRGTACVRFTCIPLHDAASRRIGTRGIGMLETEAETRQHAVNETGIDRLTGLLNRRSFLKELSRRVERLDREGGPGTLMFANLDHFRALNHRLGPVLGDQVLARVAALFAATLRPTDLIGRLDGDGFGVWMGGADHMTAAERAETLRLGVPLAVASVAGPDAPPCGISIGIAPRQHDSGETIEMLMRRADRAMAAAKRGGRSHWRVAHVTDP
jgi:diguanylate cyclase (GGDEF)-like protein